MKKKFSLKSFFVSYRVKLLGFLRQNQLSILILVIIALSFLYLRQTAYFEPFGTVNIRTFVFFIWLLAIFLLKIKAHFSLLLALFTFLLCLVLEKIGIPFWAARLSTYTYYFLAIAALQYLYEVARLESKSAR